MRNDESAESSLASLVDDGYIAEVLHTVKSGKEGTVYCCRGGPMAGSELLAAKVYHPLESRGFRNDAAYQGGRLRGERVRRERLALSKKTGYGRKVQFGVWIDSEFQTLRRLHAAGADVPRPIARNEGALLMDYLGDVQAAAPPLVAVELERSEAEFLFKRLLGNVALFLDNDRVHADLSPYNVLYHAGSVTVIDFPQAVDPRFNRDALGLLQRDLANVCRYFARFGVRANPENLARQMWAQYCRGGRLTTL